MANIELPRDAEGREIPLDTKVLYDKKNNAFRKVLYFTFRPNSGNNGAWTVVFENKREMLVSKLYLKATDNWDKLEEDLDRCSEAGSSCFYFSKDGTCRNCTLYDGSSNDCISQVYEDIKNRIRILRGETHVG